LGNSERSDERLANDVESDCICKTGSAGYQAAVISSGKVVISRGTEQLT
jgi:hypothetical protein